jgi:hypothetical protein
MMLGQVATDDVIAEGVSDQRGIPPEPKNQT